MLFGKQLNQLLGAMTLLIAISGLTACGSSDDDTVSVDCTKQSYNSCAISHPASNARNGESCIQSGCHDGGTSGAPHFAVAGTVFTGVSSTTRASSGSVKLYSGSSNTVLHTIEIDANGNFYVVIDNSNPQPIDWSNSSLGITPGIAANTMSSTINTANNDQSCNRAGCHVAGNRLH